MKKNYLLTLLLTAFFAVLSVHGVHAQTSNSISGDQICGGSSSKECTLADFKTVFYGFISFIVKIAVVVLPTVIAIRIIIAYKENVEGNPSAYAKAKNDIVNGLIGFIIIVAVLGGVYLVILQFIGVNPQLLKLLSNAFIPHAYAADASLLPNPVPGITSVYDFIVIGVKLIMSFFVYPALIAMWVWAGFSYVAAQGNPEALTKANKWLLWAVVSTVIIFMLQGFIFALQGTANKILPTNTLTTPVNNTGSQTAPSLNVVACSGRAAGTACQVGSNTGICTASGVCDIGSVCAGKSAGDVCQLGNSQGHCDITGICFLDSNQTVLPSSCYQLPTGTRCKLGSDLGTCDPSGICFLDKNASVLPSSCYQLAVGTRCKLGSNLGTCDASGICFLDKNKK